jgi:hypothetical protein
MDPPRGRPFGGGEVYRNVVNRSFSPITLFEKRDFQAKSSKKVRDEIGVILLIVVENI